MNEITPEQEDDDKGITWMNSGNQWPASSRETGDEGYAGTD